MVPILKDLNDLLKKSHIDECRVSIVDSRLQVTHHVEVSAKLANAIQQNKLLEDVKAICPKVVNIQILPEFNGKNNVKCSTLTLEVNVKHNTVEKIDDLAEACQTIHFAVLDAAQRDLIISAVNKDLKPYDE
ncbi:MAG: hypothetical protein ABS939_09320 [Psychrobacillus sp.]